MYHHRSTLPTRIAGIIACCLCSQASAGFGCGEGFEDVGHLAQIGWIFRNNSQEPGTTAWYQGDPSVFTAWAGPPDSYAAADADNASGENATISSWLITPEIDFGPNDFSVRLFDFYTRAVPDAPNRLIVRVCIMTAVQHCAAPRSAWSDVGGYNTTLLDINPELTPTGYPDEWTEYVLTPADGLPVVGRGRIAFHYFTTPQTGETTGSYIGIDAVTMAGTTACPFTDILLVDGFESTE